MWGAPGLGRAMMTSSWRSLRVDRPMLLAAAALLAVAGMAAGGVLAFRGGGGPGTVPWLATRPTLGSVNPPLASACTAAQLQASLSLTTSRKRVDGELFLVNRSSQACSLIGRPRLSSIVTTAKWRVRGLGKVSRAFLDPLGPRYASLRQLRPGAHVGALISSSNWCGSRPAAMVLTAPGGGSIQLSDRIRTGATTPVCESHPAPSTLEVTNFYPYVPTRRGGSSPLSAGINRGPEASLLRFTNNPKPVAAVHPGSWFRYTIVLTNGSRKSFSFGSACPAYVEGFGYGDQAFVLNCHAIGAIAPHRSARFAMRVRVPPLPKGESSLEWRLVLPAPYDGPEAFAVVAVH